jgi:hypothetical protein
MVLSLTLGLIGVALLGYPIFLFMYGVVGLVFSIYGYIKEHRKESWFFSTFLPSRVPEISKDYKSYETDNGEYGNKRGHVDTRLETVSNQIYTKSCYDETNDRKCKKQILHNVPPKDKK